MSNAVNDVIIESLYDRLATIIERVTPIAADELDRLVKEGDIEHALDYMDTLEAVYADDL